LIDFACGSSKRFVKEQAYYNSSARTYICIKKINEEI
jgi:hypothetical protein